MPGQQIVVIEREQEVTLLECKEGVSVVLAVGLQVPAGRKLEM